MKSFFNIKTLASILSGALGMSMLLGFIYYINPPMPGGHFYQREDGYEEHTQLELATGTKLYFVASASDGDTYYLTDVGITQFYNCGINVFEGEVQGHVLVFPKSSRYDDGYYCGDRILTLKRIDAFDQVWYRFKVMEVKIK